MNLRFVVVAFSVLATSAVACTQVQSRRPESVSAKEVTYDDGCQLQSYFDQREKAGLKPIQPATELAIPKDGLVIGQGRYHVRDPFARRRLSRLLADEYSGIDAKVIRAVAEGDGAVLVEASWVGQGNVRRLVGDHPLVVVAAGQRVEVPLNTCLGDFLFGDAMYAMRAQYLRNEVKVLTGQVESQEFGADLDALVSGSASVSISISPGPADSTAPSMGLQPPHPESSSGGKVAVP